MASWPELAGLAGAYWPTEGCRPLAGGQRFAGSARQEPTCRQGVCALLKAPEANGSRHGTGSDARLDHVQRECCRLALSGEGVGSGRAQVPATSAA